MSGSARDGHEPRTAPSTRRMGCDHSVLVSEFLLYEYDVEHDYQLHTHVALFKSHSTDMPKKQPRFRVKKCL